MALFRRLSLKLLVEGMVATADIDGFRSALQSVWGAMNTGMYNIMWCAWHVGSIIL